MKKYKTGLGYLACQIQSVHQISKVLGKDEDQGLSVGNKIKTFIKRRLGLNFIRTRRKVINRVLNWWNHLDRKQNLTFQQTHPAMLINLKAGDRVRVRSEVEIRATLNRWNELKGCAFIDEMAIYCGTTQRVFKPIERFVDERDYQPKKVRGVVLLEGLICNGTAYYGKCDRSCLYFWREEWLEKFGE